jgi:hypothetical protein
VRATALVLSVPLSHSVPLSYPQHPLLLTYDAKPIRSAAPSVRAWWCAVAIDSLDAPGLQRDAPGLQHAKRGTQHIALRRELDLQRHREELSHEQTLNFLLAKTNLMGVKQKEWETKYLEVEVLTQKVGVPLGVLRSTPGSTTDYPWEYYGVPLGVLRSTPGSTTYQRMATAVPTLLQCFHDPACTDARAMAPHGHGTTCRDARCLAARDVASAAVV